MGRCVMSASWRQRGVIVDEWMLGAVRHGTHSGD